MMDPEGGASLDAEATDSSGKSDRGSLACEWDGLKGAPPRALGREGSGAPGKQGSRRKRHASYMDLGHTGIEAGTPQDLTWR